MQTSPHPAPSPPLHLCPNPLSWLFLSLQPFLYSIIKTHRTNLLFISLKRPKSMTPCLIRADYKLAHGPLYRPHHSPAGCLTDRTEGNGDGER